MADRDPRYGPSILVRARKAYRQMRLMEQAHYARAELLAIDPFSDAQARARARLMKPKEGA